jgi:hypothetical protein
MSLAAAGLAALAGCSLAVLPVPVGGLSQEPVAPGIASGSGGTGGYSITPACPDGGDGGAGCADANDASAEP